MSRSDRQRRDVDVVDLTPALALEVDALGVDEGHAAPVAVERDGVERIGLCSHARHGARRRLAGSPIIHRCPARNVGSARWPAAAGG